MTRLFSFIVFTLSIVISAAPQAKVIEYTEVNGLANLATKLTSPYSRINAWVSINDERYSMQDVEMWLQRNGKRIQTLNVGTDGKVTLPALSDNDAEHTELRVSPSGNAVSLSVNANIAPPTTKAVSYREMFSVLDDAEALMSEMAGAVAWFIPSPNTLIFMFDEPAQIRIGSQHFQTDEDLKIEMKVKKSLLRSNPQILFSHLPSQIEPD